jgi:hypothetical protein
MSRQLKYIFDVELEAPSDERWKQCSNCSTRPALLIRERGKVISLRVAETPRDRDAASRMLNRRFGWRGYGADHLIPNDESHTTFIALLDEEVVGTITLGVDVWHGLAIDAVFKDEVDRVRAKAGRQVCELTKFAFESEMPDQRNLAMLFHTVFLYGMQKHACTDLFIEVNPRHRRYYQHMLGFLPVGSVRTNPLVKATSQLMWIDVSDLTERILLARSHKMGPSTRSLYSFFLTQSEEASVRDKLACPRPVRGRNNFNLIERTL